MDPDRPAHPDIPAPPDGTTLTLLRDGAVTDAAQQVRNRLVLAGAAQVMQLLPPDPNALLFWLFTGSATAPGWPWQDAHLGAERLELRGQALQKIAEAYGSKAMSLAGVPLCAALELWLYAPELRCLPLSAEAA